MERVSLTEYLRAALGLPDAHPVLDFHTHLHALSARLAPPPEPAKKLKRA